MPTKAPTRCRAHRQFDCADCAKPWAYKPASWAKAPSKAWRKFRKAWLTEHPFCIDCGDIATVVCHKPDTDYHTDRLNPDAIEGQRCQPCDARETGRQGRASM